MSDVLLELDLQREQREWMMRRNDLRELERRADECGVPTREIAEFLGVHTSTVRRLRDRAGAASSRFGIYDGEAVRMIVEQWEGEQS